MTVKSIFIYGRAIVLNIDFIRAIQEWPIPTYVKEVQGILSMDNYHRSHIKDLSEIATAMTRRIWLLLGVLRVALIEWWMIWHWLGQVERWRLAVRWMRGGK